MPRRERDEPCRQCGLNIADHRPCRWCNGWVSHHADGDVDLEIAGAARMAAARQADGLPITDLAQHALTMVAEADRRYVGT